MYCYCTAAQYEALYGEAERRQLTDRNRIGAADEAVFESVEAGVASTIDEYLLAPGSRVDRASLPYAVVPDRLVQIAAILIRYRLFGVSRPETVIEDQKEAMLYLESVAAGKLVPGGAAAQETARQTYGESQMVSGGGRVFGEDNSFI